MFDSAAVPRRSSIRVALAFCGAAALCAGLAACDPETEHEPEPAQESPAILAGWRTSLLDAHRPRDVPLIHDDVPEVAFSTGPRPGWLSYADRDPGRGSLSLQVLAQNAGHSRNVNDSHQEIWLDLPDSAGILFPKALHIDEEAWVASARAWQEEDEGWHLVALRSPEVGHDGIFLDQVAVTELQPPEGAWVDHYRDVPVAQLGAMSAIALRTSYDDGADAGLSIWVNAGDPDDEDWARTDLDPQADLGVEGHLEEIDIVADGEQFLLAGRDENAVPYLWTSPDAQEWEPLTSEVLPTEARRLGGLAVPETGQVIAAFSSPSAVVGIAGTELTDLGTLESSTSSRDVEINDAAVVGENLTLLGNTAESRWSPELWVWTGDEWVATDDRAILREPYFGSAITETEYGAMMMLTYLWAPHVEIWRWDAPTTDES